MVHRDIKPENIILTDDGGLKLTDLGLACRCGRSTRGFSGTVLYAAPEQFLGEEPESTVDWYSLGLMLYEMSTGRHPSAARHATTVMMLRLEETPPRVDELNAALSPGFADLVAAMLEREPQERLDSLTPAVRAAVRNRFVHSAKARSADELREHGPMSATASISVADSRTHRSTMFLFTWRARVDSASDELCA
jgi:serine/threonine protein kinase